MRDALPDPRGRPARKVIGVGNAYRTDDAVGLAVARALAGTLPEDVVVLDREGEPTSLIAAWEGADTVWIVDAVSSGAAPGTVHRVVATEEPVPASFARSSTHHVGLPEAIELSRVVGRLPRRLVLYGVEGRSFAAGASLTPEVAAAVDGVAAAIRTEILEA